MKFNILIVIFFLGISLTVFSQEINWERAKGDNAGGTGDIYLWPDSTLVTSSFLSGIKYVSYNEGETWSKFDYPFENEEFSPLVINQLSTGEWITLADRGTPGNANALYKSENRGEDWQQIDGSTTISPFDSFDFKILNDSIFFAKDVYEGIVKTTDQGRSWDVVFPLKENSTVNLIDFSSEGLAFIRTSDSVYVSPDTGKTWSSIDDIRAFYNTDYYLEEVDNTMYLSYKNNTYVSYDSSKSWSFYSGEDGVDRILGNFISLSDSVFLAFNQWFNAKEIVRSTDKGKTWKGIKKLNEQYLSRFTFDSTSNKVFISDQFGLLVSDDLGENWREVRDGLSTYNGDVIFKKKDGKFLIGTARSNSFLYSEDREGKQWKVANIDFNNIISEQVEMRQTRGFTEFKGSIFAVTGLFLLESSDGGLNWILNNSLPFEVFFGEQVHIYATDSLLFLSHNSKIIASSDGVTFKDKVLGFEENYVSEGIFLDQSGELYSYGNGLYEFNFKKEIWEKISDLNEEQSISELYKSKKGIFYVSSYKSDFMLRISSDGGKTWRNTEERVRFYSILEDSLNDRIFFHGENFRYNNILVVDDTLSSTKVLTIDYNTLKFPLSMTFNSEDNLVFSSAGDGVFISDYNLYSLEKPEISSAEFIKTDSDYSVEINWDSNVKAETYYLEIYFDQNLDELVLDTAVTSFSFDGSISLSNSADTLFARLRVVDATGESSNWSNLVPFSSQGIINSSEQVIEFKLDLEQNYPNPFNPQTSISFSLPTNGFTNLSIFDLLGQKVVTLVDGQKSAGNYTVIWNASTYASGFYFYQLTTNNKVLTKKMLLIK